MSLTKFTLLNLKRLLNDWANLIFSILLPVALFLFFGVAQAQQQGTTAPEAAHGNISAIVMVSMAVFGGAIAACGSVGSIVAEQNTGWGRQLALTSLSQRQLLCERLLEILVRALLPLLALFITGFATNAEMDTLTWFLAFGACLIGSMPFGLYGMMVGLLFRTESAVGFAASLISLFGFIGNAFIPLNEELFNISRFTPMYGSVALARYPLTDGYQLLSGDPHVVHDPLWYALVNLAAWTLFFTLVCLLLGKRQKGRG